MQGLMYRLAELDADSAGMVRVIDYFDALVRHGADTAGLLRASAALAGCVVGMELPGAHGVPESRRCGPRGEWAPENAGRQFAGADIVIDDVPVGRVWLEREGAALALDAIVLDRMALTAAMIVQPRRAPSVADHSQSLVRPMDDASVLEACAALGLDPMAPARVVSATGLSAGIVRLVPSISPLGRVVEVMLDDERLLVCSPEVADASAPGGADDVGRVGVSLTAPVSAVHRLVGTARFARTRATARRPMVIADSLGALTLLAPDGPSDPDAVPDIAIITALDATDPGRELVDTLRAYLDCGTLRSAADRLHLHHSSVAQRLARLSQHVGFTVDGVDHRARATAMIMVVDARSR